MKELMKDKPKKKNIVSKIKRIIPGQEKISRRFTLRKKGVIEYTENDGEERISKHKRPRSLKIDAEKSKLSVQRKSLANVDDIMAKLEEFLDFEYCISHQNKRNVMHQARKLFSGEGIRYESPRYGWPEGCYFKKDVKITPMSNFAELIIEGQACEDKWGRDHGNGWLIKGPLTKLFRFKQFILDNPSFLTSELGIFQIARNQEESKEVIIIDEFDSYSQSSSDSTTVASQTASQNDEEAAIQTQARILLTYSKRREQEKTGPTSPIINIDDSPTILSTQAVSHNHTHAAFMPSFSSPTTLSTQAASHNNTRAAFMPSYNSPHLRLKALENEVFGKEEGYKCLLTRLRDLEDFLYGRMERDKIITTGYGMEFRLYRLEKELRV